MAYKTLLTVVTELALVKPTLGIAVALARRESAHLEVLALGVDRTQASAFYPGDGAILLQQTMQMAQDDAQALEKAARAALEQEDLPWSLESGAVQLGGLTELVAQRARFCDLVVVPKPPTHAPTRDGESVIEAALFEGCAPVLVVPVAGLPEAWGENVVFAWNQSREAMNALRAALPLLQAAKNVSIAIIDPPSHGPERSDPGGALSQMLSRHGVHAEVSVLAKTLPNISDVLNRHVRDRGAGLVIMGAYGHSRLRESILGGATRGMLDKAEVPVLLAH